MNGRSRRLRNPPLRQVLTPMVPSNWNLSPQAPWLLRVVQYPLVQILAACPPSLHSFAPTGSTAFSQRYITALAAQTNHGKCLPKATKCFWLSRKLSMQSIQVTHIESNGVTAFAPRYGFLSFSQPILILFLILFIQVNSRLYSKRSFFGSRSIQVVENFFKGDEFINNPSRIAAYAKWAVRNNGPALWRVPTPENCRHGPDSPQYTVCLQVLTLPFLTLFLHSLQLIFLNPTSLSKFLRFLSRGARVLLWTTDIF